MVLKEAKNILNVLKKYDFKLINVDKHNYNIYLDYKNKNIEISLIYEPLDGNYLNLTIKYKHKIFINCFEIPFFDRRVSVSETFNYFNKNNLIDYKTFKKIRILFNKIKVTCQDERRLINLTVRLLVFLPLLNEENLGQIIFDTFKNYYFNENKLLK